MGCEDLAELEGKPGKVENTEEPPDLDSITNEQLKYWLSRLVLEVRNVHEEEYKGGTLYELCAGIQQCRDNISLSLGSSASVEPLDIYKDNKFAYFRSTFESVLKNFHQKGIGTVKKQAE